MLDSCRKCGSRDWYVSPAGQRQCRVCRRVTAKAYNERNPGRNRASDRKRRTAKPETYMLWFARQRAKRAEVPCTITHADIRATWPSDDRCPVLDLPLIWGWHGQGQRPNSATLDRVDPAAGYVPGNIAVISSKANTMKSNGTASDLRRVADWLDSRKGG